MIKYSKEEFPPRFSVYEHVCNYCGVTFFSNRKRTQYDTGTCRAKAWKERKTSTSTSTSTSTPKSTKIKSLSIYNEEPSTYKEAESVMKIYFPEYNFYEIFKRGIKRLKSINGKYWFEVERTQRIIENFVFEKTIINIFKEE